MHQGEVYVQQFGWLPGTARGTEQLERMEQENFTKDAYTNYSLSSVFFSRQNELPTLKLSPKSCLFFINTLGTHEQLHFSP